MRPCRDAVASHSQESSESNTVPPAMCLPGPALLHCPSPRRSTLKNLFDASALDEITARLGALRPGTGAQWGTMKVGQMLAHCSIGVETALGDVRPPRTLIGRVLGPIVKPLALGNDAPMRQNSPTSPVMRIHDERDLDAERVRLRGLIQRFAAAGPRGCTTYPHAFFGRLTPAEWGVLMYKHLDHHLRQFGA